MPRNVLAIAVGSGLYLASDLGPGPRDGLMTGQNSGYQAIKKQAARR